MKIGYARVSTQDQNLDRQIDALTIEGCEKIYQEKITGKKKHRPELDKLLEHLRPGDVVVVNDLTRLSRSTKDLIDFMDILKEKGVDIKSLKEGWLDTTTSVGKFLFTVMAGISQFERDLTSDRTLEGLAAARARGRVGGRRPKNNDKVEIALQMYADKKYSLSKIEQATGMSKCTIYRYVKKKAIDMYNTGEYNLEDIAKATGISLETLDKYLQEEMRRRINDKKI